jgi:two-component system nitrogen regulation sensor histidine kinase NtrY
LDSKLVAIRRWWRARTTLTRSGILALLCLLTFNIVYRFFSPEESSPIKNNLLVFFLYYMSVVFLSVLAFLIGRNVVKLIFDRKHNILGSQLRTKLVVAFGGLALLTSFILFIFAGGLLSNALKAFFSVQIEDAVQGAVDIGKYQYGLLKKRGDEASQLVLSRIKQTHMLDDALSTIERQLEAERTQHQLYALTILDSDKQVVVSVRNAAASIETFQEPPFDSKAIQKALNQGVVELFEENNAQNFIRFYRPLMHRDKPYVLIATIRIDTELSGALSRVNDTFREYSQTKLFKDTLRSGYLITLLLVTGVTLFAAIWFGFYLSKQLTTPMQQLALATRRVARGDYETTIDVQGDDELSFLARSFNAMIQELKTTRDEAERRGTFIETILSRLGVSVIALDLQNRVTQINESSERLFFGGVRPQLDCDYREILPDSVATVVAPLLEAIDENDSQSIREAEISVPLKKIGVASEDETKLVCTVGALNDRSGTRIGSLMLFDDITELTKAQSIAVWREVARRIAHEIKNPLTPIRLSAQRLQKLLKDSEHSEKVLELASTIVQNVDGIKRLANEFSDFARMPTLELREASLDIICREVMQLYGHIGEDINLQYIPDPHIPPIMVDPEQIKRVLINLFDNAVDALKNLTDETKVIQLKTYLEPKHIKIEVIDNGSGVPVADRIRIFEPYFTTKKEGTGLGLGIVLSIISDHQGTIKIMDNPPHGARFVITLPRLSPQSSTTQRRLASA